MYLLTDGSPRKVVCVNVKEVLAGKGGLGWKVIAEGLIVDFDIGAGQNSRYGVVVVTEEGRVYRIGGSLGGKGIADDKAGSPI